MKSSVVALAVLWAGMAVAQTPPPPPGHGGPFQIDKLATLLDLSDTQKTEVQAVLDEEHSKMKALFDQAKASGTKPTFEQMRSAHEQVKEDTIQKLTPVLSDTQLKKFEILAEDHGPPRGPWHGQSSSSSSSSN
jgi:Spy/CpxP family protein refolding chaperone